MLFDVVDPKQRVITRQTVCVMLYIMCRVTDRQELSSISQALLKYYFGREGGDHKKCTLLY